MQGAAETKLVFPGLAGFYASWGEIAYALVRVVIGCILFMHGWGKINTGLAGVAGFMTKNGLVPGELFAASAMPDSPTLSLRLKVGWLPAGSVAYAGSI